MSTDKQNQARRDNIRLSHGPKTPAGKAASSQNAVKFGFFARNPVLPGESELEYTLYRAKMTESLAPVGAIESMLAESLVSAAWRLRRFPFVETGLFSAQYCDDQAEFAGNEALEADLDEIALDPINEAEKEARTAGNVPENALGRAFLHDAKTASAFTRLSRYESTMRRGFQRDLAELQRLQALRAAGPQKPFLQNEAAEELNALPLAS